MKKSSYFHFFTCQLHTFRSSLHTAPDPINKIFFSIFHAAKKVPPLMARPLRGGGEGMKALMSWPLAEEPFFILPLGTFIKDFPYIYICNILLTIQLS